MAEYKTVEDELDAIMNGNFEVAEAEEEVEEEIVEDELDTNDEDTDHTDESEEDTETNDEDADLDQETDETEDEEDEENTPVDEDGLEEDDSDEDDSDNGEDDEDESSDTDDDGKDESEEDEESDEDDTETDDDADGAESETTDDVDYKKQFEELLLSSKTATDFYEQVAGVKFKANGKEFTGFKDPKKIIQAQQMAYNYSEKMAGFKTYRPYMGPLKERGMLEDPAKFDLAMSLIDGDKEALKQHIQNLGLDPIEFDMENIEYKSESKTTSRDVIAIEDALASAKDHGVEDKVYNTVMKEWDDTSFREFVGNPKVQEDLIAQMEDGSYDIVMSKVKELGVLDTTYAAMPMVDQYRKAITDLVAEDTAKQKIAEEVTTADKVVADKAVQDDADRAAAQAAEKASKLKAKKATKYKAEVAKKNKAAKEAREKATAASKPKPNASKRPKEDPMSFDGAGIENFLDKMIMGKK